MNRRTFRPPTVAAAILIAAFAGFATAGAAAATEPAASDPATAQAAVVEPPVASPSPEPAPDAGEAEQPPAPAEGEPAEAAQPAESAPAPAPGEAGQSTEPEQLTEPEHPSETGSAPASGAPGDDEAEELELEPEPAPAAQTFAVASTPPALPSTVEVNGCTMDVEYPFGTEVQVNDIYNCLDVVIPALIEGLPVTTVGDGDRMSGAGNIVSLALPSTVHTIGSHAFSQNSALASVTFPEGLQRIDGQAFAGARALTEVILPSTMQSIGGRAFENARALAHLDLGGTASIGGLAFSGTALTELTIPESVTRVDDTGFGNIASLRAVTVEGDPSAFTKHTFVNDAGLEKVVFHSKQASATFVSTMFVGAATAVPGGPKVFFHDGAFGFQCDPVQFDEVFLGGTVFAPRCLFEVSFTDPEVLGGQFLPHVEEGTVLTDDDVTLVPFADFGERFAGWEPALPHTVVTDVDFLPVFEPLIPGDYTPSEEDLLQDLQGGFAVDPTVLPGEPLTLVLETPEPQPIPEEGGLPTLEIPVASVQSVSAGDEPEEETDPNEFIDVLLFSTPVELVIESFTDTSVTVRIPEGTTPGEHKIAIYSVFGQVFGWQELTVLAPTAPESGTPGGETDGDETDGDEGAGDEGTGNTDGQGAAGGAAGGVTTIADAGAEAAADGSDAGTLASTGGEPQVLLIVMAALLGVGGVLLGAQRWAH